jgi:hypothetical protein
VERDIIEKPFSPNAPNVMNEALILMVSAPVEKKGESNCLNGHLQ